MKQYDVAVIGGGPAGAAAAIVLAHAGLSVLLAERDAICGFKIGEGLPPAAQRLLKTLGVWQIFLANDHLRSLGNAAAWATNALHYTDFIRDPHGAGWHLNRPYFDAMLRHAACQAGAELRIGLHVRHVERDTDRWIINRDEQLNARWLIDATGRRATIARQRNAPPQQADQLVALIARFQSSDPEQITLVEAIPDGWWYSSRLPNGERVVVLHSDADLVAGRQHSAEFFARLQQTTHIKQRLEGAGQIGHLSGAAANSQQTPIVQDEAWLPVGDAAIGFDPIASQGIFFALYSGIQAGEAIIETLQTGERHRLNAYHARRNTVWQRYRTQHHQLYHSVARWADRPFWQRRQLK